MNLNLSDEVMKLLPSPLEQRMNVFGVWRLQNLEDHIDDLEAKDAKVTIEDPSNFHVDHFEREGTTSVIFGEKATNDDKKRILDQTINDDKAKEAKDDAALQAGTMNQEDHDKMHEELEKGIKASQDEES